MFYYHSFEQTSFFKRFNYFHDFIRFLFENTNVVMPDPSIFFSITAAVAESAVVNPEGTQTLLANGMNTFFNNGNPTGINGLRKLRNLPS